MPINDNVVLVTGGGQGIGRAQTPEDIAAFVSFFAGPDSDDMT